MLVKIKKISKQKAGQFSDTYTIGTTAHTLQKMLPGRGPWCFLQGAEQRLAVCLAP